MAERLFEFRLYERAISGEWVKVLTYDDREYALEQLAEMRLATPTKEYRLARRSIIEEWLDA